MPDQTANRWKLLNVLLLGMLIPMLAAAIPWFLDRASAKHDLEYTYAGPIVTKNGFAYNVTVQNNGSKPEEDVKVWIPVPVSAHIDYAFPEGKPPQKNIVKPLVNIETNITSTHEQSNQDNKKEVISVPELRPNEKMLISVLASGGDVGYINEFELSQLRLVSRDTLGTLNAPDDELNFLYKMGTWLFIVFIVFILGVATYYEYLIPYEKKEKDLLKQIDKLRSRQP